jgi:hypothetical protein
LKKKSVIAAILLSCVFVFALAQTPAPPKPEDVLKNLVRVEKVQDPPEAMKPGFDSITAKDSLAMLNYIASDLLEGREVGTRGYRLAAEYAASLMALWNIKPAGDPLPMSGAGRGMAAMAPAGPAAAAQKGYLQEFALKQITNPSSRIGLEIRKGDTLAMREFHQGIDFTSMSSTAGTITAPVVFAGYGITEKEIGYDDFRGLDVKGKIVLIFTEAPGKDNPASPFQKKELKDKYFPAPMPMMRGGGGFNKAREIAKLGPAAILQVQNTISDAQMFNSMSRPRPVDDSRPIIKRERRRLLIPGSAGTMPWEGSPTITISREMADAILDGAGLKIDDLQKKIESSGKSASTALPGTRVTIENKVDASFVRCSNVIGYIEGSDPALKDEVVVIGAHYDHLGAWEDYVFNGADDNGSGSVGVLNIARAMALNPKKPKRTVVFALWTGEESGLLGSRYYVRNPAFPIEKTVAYLNMDMISRPYDAETFGRMARMFSFPGGEDVLKTIKVADFLPISFSEEGGFADIFRTVNDYVGLEVFLREASGDAGRGMGGSDHSSFAAVNVPWMFAITAMTSDYHQTSDSVEKVSGELIARVSRLVYATAYMLADK